MQARRHRGLNTFSALLKASPVLLGVDIVTEVLASSVLMQLFDVSLGRRILGLLDQQMALLLQSIFSHRYSNECHRTYRVPSWQSNRAFHLQSLAPYPEQRSLLLLYRRTRFQDLRYPEVQLFP